MIFNVCHLEKRFDMVEKKFLTNDINCNCSNFTIEVQNIVNTTKFNVLLANSQPIAVNDLVLMVENLQYQINILIDESI